jgi:hypothetical protein
MSNIKLNTIIAGSRGITDLDLLETIIKESGLDISVVISGMAIGVDTLGLIWAKKHNIPTIEMPADWNKYGKSAGYIRNTEMSKKADALICLWDGESRGTRNMIDLMEKKKSTFICVYDTKNKKITKNYIL